MRLFGQIALRVPNNNNNNNKNKVQSKKKKPFLLQHFLGNQTEYYYKIAKILNAVSCNSVCILSATKSLSLEIGTFWSLTVITNMWIQMPKIARFLNFSLFPIFSRTKQEGKKIDTKLFLYFYSSFLSKIHECTHTLCVQLSKINNVGLNKIKYTYEGKVDFLSDIFWGTKHTFPNL